MDANTPLAEVGAALQTASCRNAELIGSAGSLDVPIPGSEWTVADAAAHVVISARVLTGVADGHGFPFPLGEDWSKESFALENARRIDELDESNPGRMVQLLLAAVNRFLDRLSGRAADELVSFSADTRLSLFTVACIALSEQTLHGYDMATALHRPFPIDPSHAGLALTGLGPVLPLLVNRKAAQGLTAAFEIDVRGGGRFITRFDDGRLTFVAPEAGPVDCTISADPVGLLLVASGRLSQWAAITLGLLSADGSRPDLALAFTDLFIYP